MAQQMVLLKGDTTESTTEDWLGTLMAPLMACASVFCWVLSTGTVWDCLSQMAEQ